MLVEDDPTMLNLLGTLLDMEGFEVIKLARFDSVLEEIKAEMPDVVLMDVHLNDADGLAFCAGIRGDAQIADIKVIMSSGMDKLHESEQAGADDFLLKPYMPDELIAKIKMFLG
jgi:DNA-binding response OmpR family regulator